MSAQSIESAPLGVRNRHDLISRLRKLLPEEAEFFLFYRTDKVIPSLCAGWIDDSPVLPQRTEEAKKTLNSLRDAEKHRTIRLGRYSLLLVENAHVVESSTFENIGHLLNTFLFDSLTFLNSLEDQIAKKLEDFDFLNADKEPIGHEIFLGLLNEQFGVTGSIFRIVGERVTHESHDKDGPLDDLPLKVISHRIHEALDNGRVIELDPEDSAFTDLIVGMPEKIRPAAIYIFPIRGGPLGQVRTNEFVLLKKLNGRELPLPVTLAIDRCIDAYVHTRTSMGQQKCLMWQSQQLAELIAETSRPAADHDRAFAHYLQTLGHFVIRATQAHSFAFLAYDAARKSLVRTVAVANPDDELPSGADEQEVTLRQGRQFLSANLFDQAHRTDCLVIPNINSPKVREQLCMFGLECRRNKIIDTFGLDAPRTQAEIAVIVEDQGVPVGVLCIEYPYSTGLTLEEGFIRQVASNVSSHCSVLYRVTDQLWLRRNLELQDISHQLTKVIDILPDNPLKERLADVATKYDRSVLTDVGRNKSFEEQIDRLVEIEAGGSRVLASTGLEAYVRVWLEEGLVIREELRAAVLTITANLLRNRIHAKKFLPISITTRPSWRGLGPTVIIRTELAFAGPQTEIDVAFRGPIVRPDREHVGLYLIGVIVRTWGGRLSFDRRPGQYVRELEICIPINE